ncbi:hypothetical protein MKW92_041024, partial [Papaver armeniacum]
IYQEFAKNVTEEQVKGAYEHHGEITKVVLPCAKPGQERSRFGFVHYVRGQVLECFPAKTQGDGNYTSNLYAPPMGYWMTGGAYGVPGLAQPPLIYGGGPTPAGMECFPCFYLMDGLDMFCAISLHTRGVEGAAVTVDPGYDSSDRSGRQSCDRE